MRKFKVLHTVTGKAKKIYKPGDIISESDIPSGNTTSLVNRKFLQELATFQIPIVGPLKIAVVTAVWKRPEIFELFAEGMKNIIRDCPDISFTVIVAGSEWDKSKKMVENHGFEYIEIPNEPLAAKVNSTTYYCRNLDIHYVICLGSDDLMSVDLIREYEKHMRLGIDFIGVTDFYFYDTLSRQTSYWGGYREPNRKGHTAGACRALSSRLLQLWDWMPWENKDSLVLDKSMQDKLRATPHTIETFSMKSRGCVAMDIKSETNMTPFKLWDNTVIIDEPKLKETFGYVWNQRNN